ncbi:hypothetical protein BDU57DRAFT_515815 [Ampelomyces quisqualis]|uniref:Secreted protein n=1 Tax=Ampelomyces quisqualis TaxID=50730 RepID=A0A6A5QM59_AMPQU|nr:hypothetical protein BDU57DRAFT_515815 [Ampelomyces quisqualis]
MKAGWLGSLVVCGRMHVIPGLVGWAQACRLLVVMPQEASSYGGSEALRMRAERQSFIPRRLSHPCSQCRKTAVWYGTQQRGRQFWALRLLYTNE